MGQRTWEQQCDDAAKARIDEAEAWGEFTRQVEAGGEITVTREQLGLPEDADMGKIALMVGNFRAWFAQTKIPQRMREQARAVTGGSRSERTSKQTVGLPAGVDGAANDTDVAA